MCQPDERKCSKSSVVSDTLKSFKCTPLDVLVHGKSKGLGYSHKQTCNSSLEQGVKKKLSLRDYQAPKCKDRPCSWGNISTFT